MGGRKETALHVGSLQNVNKTNFPHNFVQVYRIKNVLQRCFSKSHRILVKGIGVRGKLTYRVTVCSHESALAPYSPKLNDIFLQRKYLHLWTSRRTRPTSRLVNNKHHNFLHLLSRYNICIDDNMVSRAIWGKTYTTIKFEGVRSQEL